MIKDIFSRDENDVCYEAHSDNPNNLGLRISAVFVLLVVSAFGSFFPIVSKRITRIQLPEWIFFLTRYFGSGVILSTGFIHLLADALETLTDPCLGGVFEDYPWAEGIALISLFSVFAFDALAHKSIYDRSQLDKANSRGNVQFVGCCDMPTNLVSRGNRKSLDSDINEFERSDVDSECEISKERMLNCVILECGVVLHSVFVGLSLAISENEFVTLYIALCFHQLFEGMGLGTRFADVAWPRPYSYVPWLLALIFSLSTPLAAGIGLGVRSSLAIGSRRGLITSGVFDAACAGILIYNSVAELMGYDFIYSSQFQKKEKRALVFGILVLGSGALAMAIVGYWA